MFYPGWRLGCRSRSLFGMSYMLGDKHPLGDFANSVDSTPTRFSYFHALVMTKSAAVEGLRPV